MALRTKLINEDTTGLDNGLDDLDAAYMNSLKESGIHEDLLEQFADITKMLKGEIPQEPAEEWKQEIDEQARQENS